MSEIPYELMMHAERLYDEGGYKSVPTIIAEAILAERERCLACQPSTAENPNEDAYQRGRFDGVMEFARAIAREA